MADGFLRGTGDATGAQGQREIAKEWPAWLILALVWGFSLWALGKLPARVPIHWDLHNQVNGWWIGEIKGQNAEWRKDKERSQGTEPAGWGP